MILILSRRKHLMGEHASGKVSTSFVAAAAALSSALPVLYFIAK